MDNFGYDELEHDNGRFYELDDEKNRLYLDQQSDHAGQSFDQLSVSPRLSAKVTYVLWGDDTRSRLDEFVRIQSNDSITLFQYNEFGGKTEGAYNDSNIYNVSVDYDYLYADPKKKDTMLTAFPGIGQDPIYRQIGPKYGGLSLSFGLVSTFYDIYPTTKELLGSPDFQPGGQQKDLAWIWLWENVPGNNSFSVKTSFNIAQKGTTGNMKEMYGDVGDANGNAKGDGCVDDHDLQLILDNITHQNPYDSSLDLNSDGSVNIADARRAMVLFTNNRGASCK